MLFLSRIIWYGVVNFSLVSCIQNDVTPSRTTEQASVRSGTAYPKREEMPSLTAAPGPSPDLASSQTKGPKPSWTGLPSSFYLSNRSDISIPFSYDTAVSILADNVENHGVLSSGSALGAPICKASVSISSATAGVLHLSNCQGNGAFSVQINENLTQDSLGNPSTSSDLLSFIVDNSPPVVAVFSPAYETDPSSVSLLPKDIAVTMSEPVALSSKSPFSLTGCLDLPAASSPVVNGATVTLPLPTNGCVAGEKLVVAFDPTAVVDAGGNPGVATSISRSYILSKVGPRVILDLAPGFIKAPLREGTNITIPVRYEASKGVVRRPQAFSAAIIAVEASYGVSCEVKFVQGTNLSEDYLTLSGCKGDGGFSFYLSGGTAQDDSGDSNNSDLLRFTVQTTGPTYTGSNPIGGKVRELPGNITFFFSKALNTELSAAAFSVGSDSLSGGSCTPSIGAVKGAGSSEGGLSVQLLATGLCDDHRVTVRVDPTKIYDVAGNSGTGEMQEISFELSKKGPPPTVTSFSFDPVSLPAVGSKIQLPASARLTLNAAVTAESVSIEISPFVSGTCNHLPTVGTIGLDSKGTALVIPLSGGSCAPGQTFSLQVDLPLIDPSVDTQFIPTSVQNPIVYTAAKSYVTLFSTKLSFSGNYYKPDQVDQCMSAMDAVNTECTGALALLSLNDGEKSGAIDLPTRYIKYYEAIQERAKSGIDGPGIAAGIFGGKKVYPETINTTRYTPYPTNDPPIVSMNGTLVAEGFQSLLNLGLKDTSVGPILKNADIFPVDGKGDPIPIYEGFVSGGAAGPGMTIGSNLFLSAGDCLRWTKPGSDSVYSVSSTDKTWGATVHNWCTDISTPYMLCLCWQ